MQDQGRELGAARLKKTVAMLLALGCFGAVNGCFGPQSQRPAVEFYSLDYVSPVSEAPRQLPFIVRVQPFQAAPPYNSTRIVYGTDRFARNRYAYHRWIAEPAQMVTFFLARDIRNSKLFQAVTTDDEPEPTHLLQGTVESFYEQDNCEQWNAILSVTVTLVDKDQDDVSRKIALQKTYAESEQCRQNSPAGLAAAMSTAMSEVSGKIISDVHNALSGSRKIAAQ